MHKIEDMVKWLVIYLKHIRTRWCRMVMIFTKQHLTRTWIQYLPAHFTNIHYHNGNICFVVVKNSHINIPSQESDKNHSNTCNTIRFHIYKMVLCCTIHGRRTPDKFFCCVIPCHKMHQYQNYTQEAIL